MQPSVHHLATVTTAAMMSVLGAGAVLAEARASEPSDHHFDRSAQYQTAPLEQVSPQSNLNTAYKFDATPGGPA